MKEFEKWFKKTENDLLAIKDNMASDETPFYVRCFHAQQAAEKYLKSYLVSKQIQFPKIHDLRSLVSLCTEINPSFIKLSEYAIKLSDYGVAPGYPDAFDDLNINDSRNAYTDALK